MRTALAALAAAALLPSSLAVADPKVAPKYSLPVELFALEADCWRWAASSQMVLSYFGKRVFKAARADKRFGQHDCGLHPVPGPCNKGRYGMLGDYEFSYEQADHTPTRGEVIDEIYHLRNPMLIGWDYAGGGSHTMVLVGYQRLTGATIMIDYPDPMPMPDQDPGNRRGESDEFCTYDDWIANDAHKLQPDPTCPRTGRSPPS